jgi:hypothetical protein
MVPADLVKDLRARIAAGELTDQEAIEIFDRIAGKEERRFFRWGAKDLPTEYRLVASVGELVADMEAQGWQLVYHTPVDAAGGRVVYWCAFRRTLAVSVLAAA